MAMKAVSFTKIQGTGNDFVLVDKIFVSDISQSDLAVWITKICERRFGVGAEGVVVFSASPFDGLLEWVFYNPDGKLANLCGNAARACVNYFCSKWGAEKILIKTPTMLINGELTERGPKISFPLKSLSLTPVTLSHGGSELRGQLIDTGVPHFVIPTKDITSWYLKKEFLVALVNHKAIGSNGCNITFLEQTAKENKTQTFERGVNDFTLSCGTGVIAAGLCALNSSSGEVCLKTPGGSLIVSCDIENNLVSLTGKTTTVFEGIWNDEDV